VPLANQLLVMMVLTWQSCAQLALHDQLIATIRCARHALGLVHAHPQRLAALAAGVD
jgi:hypothetical protein